jgi:hypothetical protein
MSMKQVYHDLIRVRNSIYWLRLYQIDDRHVAVITEVPGNPGRNSMNGLDAIVDYLGRSLKIDVATLSFFQVWPSGYTEAATDVSRVTLGPNPHWTEVDWSAILDVVGQLPAIPEHGELLKSVAALGGSEREPIMRDVFQAIPVGELPPPHAPFNCAHADRHDQIKAELNDPEDEGNLMDRELRAGKLFLQTLTPADLAACSYHDANWRVIADESVAVLEDLGVRDERSDYAEEARKRLQGKERGLLESLFGDPIIVGEGGYTNGQHRGCALRFSGAAGAAVVVGTEQTGKFDYPWTYQGDG